MSVATHWRSVQTDTGSGDSRSTSFSRLGFLLRGHVCIPGIVPSSSLAPTVDVDAFDAASLGSFKSENINNKLN